MTAIELNAHQLVLDGEVEFARMAMPAGLDRRDVERRLGSALREHDGMLWAARPVEDPSAEPVRVSVGACSRRLLDFAVRESIRAKLYRLGTATWFSKGVLSCVGLLHGKPVEQFLIEPRLELAVRSDFGDDSPLLLTSARHRWSCRSTLADPKMQQIAPGRRAVRRRGDGPQTGVIERVGNGTVLLKARDEPVEAAAGDYALLADSALVARVGGSQALAALREASGDTTRSGKRNLHAVRDRFDLADEMIERLGDTVGLPGGTGSIRVFRERAQVRMEASL